MPIWLRKFTFNKLKEHYESLQNEQKSTKSNKKEVYGPNLRPSFTSKGSKK